MTLDQPTPRRLRYDGHCSRCGRALAKGEVAVWDRAAKTVSCVACPDGATPEEPEPDYGVGGGSARREYERLSAKREAEIRGRWGRFGGVVLALTDQPQSTRAWAIGARGEEKLAQALGEVDGIRVLNDRKVKGTRRNIDHVVIAPAGVFVVDAKNYSGMVQIRDRGGFFRRDERLYVGGRDRSADAEKLGWQVEAVVDALQSAGVDPLPSVTPVLCFIDAEWPLFRAPKSYLGVRLESIRSLRALVVSDEQLDTQAVEGFTRLLAAALPAK